MQRSGGAGHVSPVCPCTCKGRGWSKAPLTLGVKRWMLGWACMDVHADLVSRSPYGRAMP